MGKIMDKINQFFKAGTWTGAAWLFSLCLMLTMLAIGYIIAHNRLNIQGREYVQLDKKEMQTIKKFLDTYPDNPDTTAGITDSIRKKRTNLIQLYLKGEYDNKLTANQTNELDSMLNLMSNSDAYDYLSEKKLSKQSFFWLTGSYAYIEIWLWCLIGVLASLIYYVSIANTKSLKTAGDIDSGSFDPAEIPGQVAKMFYAPVVTIVVILGYHYLSAGGSNMVDISMNSGLIVFSFIAGFFSARLMKFLDRLKDLILPYSSTDNPPVPATDKKPKADVTVQLQLSPALAGSPDAVGIKAKLNEAEITLTPESGGDPVSLAGTSEDKPDTFSVSQVTNGKYVLNATMAYKKDDATTINLTGQQDVEINDANSAFTLVLDKAEGDG